MDIQKERLSSVSNPSIIWKSNQNRNWSSEPLQCVNQACLFRERLCGGLSQPQTVLFSLYQTNTMEQNQKKKQKDKNHFLPGCICEKAKLTFFPFKTFLISSLSSDLKRLCVNLKHTSNTLGRIMLHIVPTSKAVKRLKRLNYYSMWCQSPLTFKKLSTSRKFFSRRCSPIEMTSSFY